MPNTEVQYEAIIIGAGPAGSTAALVLARAGLRVIVLEKSQFPRFHIGESILPRNFPLIQELGLEAALKALPHLPKYGAEFGMGNDHNTMRFSFTQGLLPGSATFNIERSCFDQMLMDQAAAAGAEIRQQCAVQRIDQLADGFVQITAADRPITARWLLDASGQGTVVARYLGIRKAFDEPRFQKVAYFEHFDGVQMLPGLEVGHPGIFMCTEGWFWLIGLREGKASIGFVTDPSLTKRVGVPANKMLGWAMARCPVLRDRTANASGPAINQVLADFSYQCSPCAGPGYFLLGDAAAFIDPIFSTGVTLAMMGAVQAANQTIALLRGTTSPARARQQYIRYVTGSTSIFWRLIKQYYQHSFRELFLNGTGPLQVHRAIISILAGQVFPKPAFSLRWRLWLFEFFIQLNKIVPLVPRRPMFSLVDAPVDTQPAARQSAHTQSMAEV
jgi:flavin-dependent dehydrogenase